MKFNKIIILIMGIAFGLSSGCKKGFFDTIPDNIVTIDGVFTNRGQSERWLGGLYSSLYDPWDIRTGFQFSVMTDELDFSNWENPGMNSGSLAATSVNMGALGYYEKIRLATIFLENIDKNQEILALNNGGEIIKQYKGEAQFLRAYYYWLLMRQYGPVEIMPLTSGKPEDNYQIPRSSWDECVTFVLKEIAEAKQKLPVNNFTVGTSDFDPTKTGRINQMIASAVESQITLYHASPLFNGNLELSDFKNLNGKQLFNQSYDPARWTKAATAAKLAIELAEANGKALYKVVDADPFRAAFLSCRNLYWDGWRTEGIWIRTANNSGIWEYHAAPRTVQGSPYNGMAVVQSLVDDFRMSNGATIGSSGYNENTYTSTGNSYYAAGTNMMYVNREPRFYVDISFNGAVIPGVPKAGQNRVEYYYTGNSGKAGETRNWPKTGYTARKNIHPTFSFSPYVFVQRPAMLIRLAELYLNYAEALNESDPGNPEILKYLNLVRLRGGIPAISGTTQAELRSQIRLERRVELCFENGSRYFDVRRWKVPEQIGFKQGGQMFGMNVDAGSSLSDPNFHKRTVAFTRAPWQRKYYFYPYGQDEMDRNKQLVQFPGY
ncbi:RagB/SusD family nutrient uptake outer membrane protein [Pedobacter agri]|uniref:RagB/SusD family nutrient uptake outer membrane protein n=1 Tax=Pedobacter agri TaxID=454586 RepID=UPI0029301964|nr:RagB/SusD family nutrient uptake outer membrane protein [Pedobacter agri]